MSRLQRRTWHAHGERATWRTNLITPALQFVVCILIVHDVRHVVRRDPLRHWIIHSANASNTEHFIAVFALLWHKGKSSTLGAFDLVDELFLQVLFNGTLLDANLLGHEHVAGANQPINCPVRQYHLLALFFSKRAVIIHNTLLREISIHGDPFHVPILLEVLTIRQIVRRELPLFFADCLELLAIRSKTFITLCLHGYRVLLDDTA